MPLCVTRATLRFVGMTNNPENNAANHGSSHALCENARPYSYSARPKSVKCTGHNGSTLLEHAITSAIPL